MTRKDYIVLAGVLRNAYTRTDLLLPQVAVVNRIAEDLCAVLAQDNPRFDELHFLAVVHGEKGLTSRP